MRSAPRSPAGPPPLSGALFAGLYLVGMLPTYLLPYMGSNASLTKAVGRAVGSPNMAPGWPFWVHLGLLVGLVLLTRARTAPVGKGWIAVFPFLALVFDLTPGLTLIPLFPTVFHVCAIVLGVRGAGSATPAPAGVSA